MPGKTFAISITNYNQKYMCISEPGLYRLIFSSRLTETFIPNIKQMTRYVKISHIPTFNYHTGCWKSQLVLVLIKREYFATLLQHHYLPNAPMESEMIRFGSGMMKMFGLLKQRASYITRVSLLLLCSETLFIINHCW